MSEMVMWSDGVSRPKNSETDWQKYMLALSQRRHKKLMWRLQRENRRLKKLHNGLIAGYQFNLPYGDIGVVITNEVPCHQPKVMKKAGGA